MNRKVTIDPTRRTLQAAWTAYYAGNNAEALKRARAAKRLGAGNPDPYYLEALALSALNHNAEARELAQAGRKRFPQYHGFTGMLGTLEVNLGNFHDGVVMLKEALEHQPGAAHLWMSLGNAYFSLGEYDEARLANARAAELQPNDAAALGNYAAAVRESGSTIESIPILRRAIALDPLQRVNRSNLLFSLLYDEHVGAQELRREATDWAETLARTPVDAPPMQPSEGHRIRIGVLSNDLRRHACAYYLIPLLANLDRERFEVHLFSLSGVTDNVTRKIQQYADKFHDVFGMNEQAVVRAVRAQRCDAMIDLGGYTGASPLQYMVHRLAPVQIAWLGYPSTTGMKEVQYRITDIIGDPVGFESNYTETLLRAPLFCAFHPHVTAPLAIYEPRYRVVPTPALQNGYITFGSCNHIAKLGPKTMRLWSAVLARCPGSKLLVESAGVERATVRDMVLRRMQEHGIDTERVILVPRDGANQYVTYHGIDIALDTAPVTGGTTTCDALWMGVPVVTLSGDTFHQRVSAPFLHITGLNDLICDTEERYVEVACALAADVQQLDNIRQSLRPQAEAGPMFDAPAFAGWVEDQLTEICAETKRIAPRTAPRQDGIFFGGRHYTAQDLLMSVAAHIHLGEWKSVYNVLENLTSTWYRHWAVAYGLAEYKYHNGEPDLAIELLVEAIGMRPYALALYRKLAQWLAERDLDRSALAALLEEQFGLTLAALEASPAPNVFETLGLELPGAAVATRTDEEVNA
ncbi:O-linked N-acetylglucosamine transferase family protein [Cupriavidus agavae]|uniref:protein O-GlcNAc transferase n=1 Tax=Cupriavidus agavae TaxID=1001822 RepID=A0A4Q7RCF3_9BURK|nr:tetratricopeptide repeat protein [Cupriavidus agavae]RZT30831.1 putative O-linked N-acetylglucosamine transferase (SPINDLY family) [Cupriavidus agavae]